MADQRINIEDMVWPAEGSSSRSRNFHPSNQPPRKKARVENITDERIEQFHSEDEVDVVSLDVDDSQPSCSYSNSNRNREDDDLEKVLQESRTSAALEEAVGNYLATQESLRAVPGYFYEDVLGKLQFYLLEKSKENELEPRKWSSKQTNGFFARRAFFHENEAKKNAIGFPKNSKSIAKLFDHLALQRNTVLDTDAFALSEMLKEPEKYHNIELKYTRLVLKNNK